MFIIVWKLLDSHNERGPEIIMCRVHSHEKIHAPFQSLFDPSGPSQSELATKL